MTTTLGIFCRYPQPGQVKTRLARIIGDTAAAALYSAILIDTVAGARHLADRLVLAVTPDDSISRNWFERNLGDAAEFWPQPSGTLGERLAAFFQSPAARTADRTIVTGSDCPSLPAEYITSAFVQLLDYDVVLGPTTDGGYYLLGVANGSRPAQHSLSPTLDSPTSSRFDRGREGRGDGDSTNASSAADSPWTDKLFHNIDWSSPQVLKQTLERVTTTGRSCSLLPPWYDLDTIDDLNQLKANLAALQAAGVASPCPRTAHVLSTL